MGLLRPSGQGPMVFMQMSLDFEGAHMHYCHRSPGDPLKVRFQKPPASVITTKHSSGEAVPGLSSLPLTSWD